MIIVITYYDKELGMEIVSHGFDDRTSRNVVLPQCTPREIGATYNQSIGEWVLY